MHPPDCELPSTSDTTETEEFMITTAANFDLEREDVENWLNCDRNEVGHQILTDTEIIEEVTEAGDDESGDMNTDYDGADSKSGTFATIDRYQVAKEACLQMEKFINWYETQDEANCTDTVLLRRFGAFAATKSQKTKT